VAPLLVVPASVQTLATKAAQHASFNFFAGAPLTNGVDGTVLPTSGAGARDVTATAVASPGVGPHPGGTVLRAAATSPSPALRAKQQPVLMRGTGGVSPPPRPARLPPMASTSSTTPTGGVSPARAAVGAAGVALASNAATPPPAMRRATTVLPLPASAAPGGKSTAPTPQERRAAAFAAQFCIEDGSAGGAAAPMIAADAVRPTFGVRVRTEQLPSPVLGSTPATEKDAAPAVVYAAEGASAAAVPGRPSRAEFRTVASVSPAEFSGNWAAQTSITPAPARGLTAARSFLIGATSPPGPPSLASGR
jgi:hypothetical protein